MKVIKLQERFKRNKEILINEITYEETNDNNPYRNLIATGDEHECTDRQSSVSVYVFHR